MEESKPRNTKTFFRRTLAHPACVSKLHNYQELEGKQWIASSVLEDGSLEMHFPTVSLFNALPDGVQERLAAMFNHRKSWKAQEKFTIWCRSRLHTDWKTRNAPIYARGPDNKLIRQTTRRISLFQVVVKPGCTVAESIKGLVGSKQKNLKPLWKKTGQDGNGSTGQRQARQASSDSSDSDSTDSEDEARICNKPIVADPSPLVAFPPPLAGATITTEMSVQAVLQASIAAPLAVEQPPFPMWPQPVEMPMQVLPAPLPLVLPPLAGPVQEHIPLPSTAAAHVDGPLLTDSLVWGIRGKRTSVFKRASNYTWITSVLLDIGVAQASTAAQGPTAAPGDSAGALTQNPQVQPGPHGRRSKAIQTEGSTGSHTPTRQNSRGKLSKEPSIEAPVQQPAEASSAAGNEQQEKEEELATACAVQADPDISLQASGATAAVRKSSRTSVSSMRGGLDRADGDASAGDGKPPRAKRTASTSSDKSSTRPAKRHQAAAAVAGSNSEPEVGTTAAQPVTRTEAGCSPNGDASVAEAAFALAALADAALAEVKAPYQSQHANAGAQKPPVVTTGAPVPQLSSVHQRHRPKVAAS